MLFEKAKVGDITFVLAELGAKDDANAELVSGEDIDHYTKN